MPYDVTIITVKPNTHMKALPGVEQWLKANPRKGEFIGCLTSEIGCLNRILLLHHYTSDADLAADRDAVAKDANPYGCVELTDGRSTDTFTQFPFLPPIKPGQYGPIFEVRTYLLKPTGLPPTIAAWTKQAPERMKLSPILAAMYSTTGEVTRFLHIWPYPDLATRAATRKTAIETGVWPPPGGPDHLLTMHTDIYLPAAFSPMR
jgi:NIPSNAP